MSDSEFAGLPSNERMRRVADIIHDEAEAARKVGVYYDLQADEFEALLDAGEIEPANSLAIDLRYLLAERNDIKNAGSVDGDFVHRLGYDVCIRPELVETCITIAKINSLEDKLDVEEIITAWDHIEERYNESIDTSKGARILLAHGAHPEEVVDLALGDPRAVRSYARLLDAPILMGYSKRLAKRSLETGELLAVDVIVGGAMRLVKKHSDLHARMEAGDQEAIEEHARWMRTTRPHLLGELAMEAEHDIDRLPPDIPVPSQNGD